MKKKSAGNKSQRQGIESTSVSQEHEETVNNQQISSHAKVIESNSVSQEHEESVTDDQISSQAQGTKKSSANNPSSTSTSANNNEDEKTTNDDRNKSVAENNTPIAIGNSRTSQDQESMNDKQIPSSTSSNKDNMENEKSSNESNTQNQLISLIDDEDTSNNTSKNLSKGNEVVNLVDSDDEEKFVNSETLISTSEQSAKNVTNESSSTTQSSAAAKNKSSLSKGSSNTENVGNESSSSKNSSSQESSEKNSANNKRKNSPSSKQSSKQREDEDKKRSNKGNQNNKLTKSSQLQDGQKLHLLRYMRYRNEYRVIECFFSKKKERTKPERIVVQLCQGYFMYYKNGTQLQFHKGSFRQFYLSSIYLDNELAEQHGQKLHEIGQKLTIDQQFSHQMRACEIEFLSEYEDHQYQWNNSNGDKEKFLIFQHAFKLGKIDWDVFCQLLHNIKHRINNLSV